MRCSVQKSDQNDHARSKIPIWDVEWEQGNPFSLVGTLYVDTHKNHNALWVRGFLMKYCRMPVLYQITPPCWHPIGPGLPPFTLHVTFVQHFWRSIDRSPDAILCGRSGKQLQSCHCTVPLQSCAWLYCTLSADYQLQLSCDSPQYQLILLSLSLSEQCCDSARRLRSCRNHEHKNYWTTQSWQLDDITGTEAGKSSRKNRWRQSALKCHCG